MVTNLHTPKVPLTQQDLRAVAGVRLIKQYNKRLVLILVPAIVMAIAGVAFHRGTEIDAGFAMVAVAMAGFLGGLIVLGRWFTKAQATWVQTHEGFFWEKGVRDGQVPTKETASDD